MNKEKFNISYCRVCKRDNRHFILFHLKRKDSDECPQFDTHFYVLECGGCEAISYKNEDIEIRDEEEDDPEWEPYVFTQIYPPVLKKHNSLIEYDSYELPEFIGEIYHDTLKAFEAESYLLAAAGFRAVIEATCKDLGITAGGLDQKINKLASNGHISKKDADRLHTVRFLGNDSLHDVVRPEESQLFIVLEIIEHLLYGIYIIDKKVKDELETVISDFKEYKSILSRKLRRFKPDSEVTIKKIFGPTFRRLSNYGDEWEKKLIKEINSGSYKRLQIGEKRALVGGKELIQHFIVN
jgi:hypothetical protein